MFIKDRNRISFKLNFTSIMENINDMIVLQLCIFFPNFTSTSAGHLLEKEET